MISKQLGCAEYLVGVAGAWQRFKQKYPEIDVDDILSRGWLH